jgi:hypothetical protein
MESQRSSRPGNSGAPRDRTSVPDSSSKIHKNQPPAHQSSSSIKDLPHTIHQAPSNFALESPLTHHGAPGRSVRCPEAEAASPCYLLLKKKSAVSDGPGASSIEARPLLQLPGGLHQPFSFYPGQLHQLDLGGKCRSYAEVVASSAAQPVFWRSLPAEVVLRHFHRHRSPRAARCGSSFWSGLRSHKVMIMKEYGGHENLCGSGRQSVIPYVHR